MSLDHLLAGLPPGRLVTPGPQVQPRVDRWAALRGIPGAPPRRPQQWARLQAIQDRTGLRPVLFWPGDAREPCRLDEIDALEAETILLREWHALERLR